jgi:DNA-binding SARP family transcriptional activator/tetratricopeptide (TPR) repeat protein
MAHVSLQLLGGFVALSPNGEPVMLASRKAQALIGFLAVHAQRSHHRTRLCSLLWEDAGEKQSRDSLRQALTTIRRAFGAQTPVIRADGDMLSLAAGIDVDVARFEACLKAGDEDSIVEACGLIRGDLLESLHIDSASHEAWLASERFRLRDLAVGAIVDGAGPQPGRAVATAKIEMAQRLLVLEPAHEGLHRALMRLYAGQGRPADALRQYERCREMLHRELSVRPDAETETLVNEIRARRLRRKPVASGAPGVDHAFEDATALPPQPTRSRQPVLRPMTVLHLELSFASGQAGADEIEKRDDIQSRMTGAIARIATDHGGCLHATLGLVHVCLFGLERGHGDDPLRAARTALRIRSHLMAAEGDTDDAMTCRAGLAFGALLVRDEADKQGRTVAGEALNEAGRLARAADDGQIIVSPEMTDALGDNVDLTPLPGQPTFAITGLSDRWRTKPLLPFVGRRVELVQFERMLTTTRSSGAGSVMIVCGEPGIGKTRLMTEFQHLAGAHAFDWHMVVLQDLPPGVAADPVAAIARSMMASCTQAGIVPKDWIDHPGQVFVEDLLGLSRSSDVDVAFGGLAAAERESGRKRALAELLRAACQTRPAVIVVENTHWIDDRTMADVTTLADAMTDQRCILVLTTRPPEAERFLQDRIWRSLPVTRVTLKLFSAREAEMFAQSFPAGDAASLRQALELSGGNPLFLEQVLRSGNTGMRHLAGIASTVLARLDALPMIDRRALDAASVLDQWFDEDIIRFMLDDPKHDIGSLVDHGLLRPSSSGVAFVHLVVQKVVHASLLTSERRAWHQRAAMWFHGRDAARHATHLERADDPEAPAAYLVAAREEFGRRRPENALIMAERAWATAKEEVQRFEIAMVSADIWRQLGRTAQAIVRYTDAARLASSVKAQAQAEIGIAASARMAGDVAFGMRTLDEGLARLDEAAAQDAASDPCSLERARIAHYRGSFMFLQGDVDACAQQQKLALFHAVQSSDPGWIARSYGGLGDADYVRGDMKGAITSFRKALSYAARSQLPDAEVANRFALAAARQFVGEMHEALADAGAASQQAAELHNLYIEMQALNLKGELLIEQGQFEPARRELDRAFAICRQLGNLRFKSCLLTSFARLHLCENDPEAASGFAERALEAARMSDVAFVGPRLHALRARISIARGGDLQPLSEGRAILDSSPNVPNALWFARDAIDACLAAGQPAEAGRHAHDLEALAQRWDLPWARFFSERGQLLAADARNALPAGGQIRLLELCRQAEEAGFGQALPALAGLAPGDGLRIVDRAIVQDPAL